jgi:hypothetical protein
MALEANMRKVLTAIAAAVSIAALIVTTPTKVEARCGGCWIGAGIAAGVIGSAIVASNSYGYYGGNGYAPVGYGYSYAPSYYSYADPAPAYYGGYYRPAYYSYAPTYYAPRYYAPRPYVRYAPYYRSYYSPRRAYVRNYYGRHHW